MTLPKTMNAAILVEQRKPLVVDEVELPESLEPGQVLVKLRFSGICGSQLGEIDGVKGEDKYLPHLLGHEGSGVVLEIGAGVKHVKPGQHVVIHWRKGVGIDANPPKYKWRGQIVNAGWATTFNDYAIVAENRVTAVPKEVDLDIAALFGCAVLTGFGVIENNARVRIGESVVVFGAGGVGLNIIQAASLVGGHPIIAVDLFDNRLELAKQMGADFTINASSEDAFSRIQEIVGAGKIDVFIDNTGLPSIIERAYNMVNQQGRVILVAVPKLDDNISIYSLPLHFGKVLTGSHGGEVDPSRDIDRYLGAYSANQFELSRVISQRLPLTEINQAIRGMREGSTAGRCLIEFEQ